MFENLKKLQADGAQGGEPVNESNCTHDCGSCPSAGGCGSFDPPFHILPGFFADHRKCSFI